jgi:hypothetical protein
MASTGRGPWPGQKHRTGLPFGTPWGVRAVAYSFGKVSPAQLGSLAAGRGVSAEEENSAPWRSALRRSGVRNRSSNGHRKARPLASTKP